MTPDHPNDVRRVTEYSICPSCGAKFGTMHIATCNVYRAVLKKADAKTLRETAELRMARGEQPAGVPGEDFDYQYPHTPPREPDHMPGVDVGEDPVTERNVVTPVPDRQYLNKPLNPEKSIEPIPANPDAVLDATSPDPGSGKGKATGLPRPIPSPTPRPGTRVPIAEGGQRIFLASKDKQRDPDGTPVHFPTLGIPDKPSPLPGSPRDEVLILEAELRVASGQIKDLRRSLGIVFIILGIVIVVFVVPKIITMF